MNILQAFEDPNLFAPAFHEGQWRIWLTVLAAAFGLVERVDATIFAEIAGGRLPPPGRVRELWCVVGRRGGKSRIASAIAVYCALFMKHKVAPGEVPVVMLLAADRMQARVLLSYTKGLLRSSAMLEKEVDGEAATSVSLRNGCRIEVHTSSFRAVRGYSLVCAIADELAFWRTDEGSANPDTEVVAAVRPALSTTGGVLVGISSPYSRRGEMWNAFKEHFGQNTEDVLVVRGATRTFNPTVSEAFIERELERDEARARSEWLAEFRTDVDAFVSREAVEACVIADRRELPPELGRQRYSAFTDPSGGSADSFTLCIAHRERRDASDIVVIDALRERRPPFSPEGVVAEYAALCKRYGVFTVSGDRYAGEWPREQFRKWGVSYCPSEKAKSDLYTEMLPPLNSGRIELLDNARAIAQLCGLERRTARSGRDSIDHAPGSHDDVANAIAGAATVPPSRASASRAGRATKE